MSSELLPLFFMKASVQLICAGEGVCTLFIWPANDWGALICNLYSSEHSAFFLAAKEAAQG